MAFAYGTKRLRLATVGILQYLSPTLSFFLGLFFFRESMKPGDLVTFSLIWAAILLYSGESLAFNRKCAKKSPPPKKGRS
jgi:chloramphenicol-sensitive protein RarD